MAIDTAIILCGGKGERFRRSAEAELEAQQAVLHFKSYPPPKTCLAIDVLEELRDTPKCLVSVCGRPLIWYKIGQLAQAGIHHVILCAGRNTSATQALLPELSRGHSLLVSTGPNSWFGSHDLGDIVKALKGRPSDSHILIAAGDCLTTTDYAKLAAEHIHQGRRLTIATSVAHGHEAFVQDSVASLGFLHQAQGEISENRSRFPHCSPLNAAIYRAWHKHTLATLPGVSDYLNINTVTEFSQLLLEPTRFLQVSDFGYPRLQEPSARQRSCALKMQR